MALAPVTLDDLKWADFNAAALLRITAASGGRWTLHAPVDPGITLLELFAWLLEQRAYWLDQVSDPLSRALLKSLGITATPARPATTVLYVEACANAAITLKKSQAAALAHGPKPLVFTTNEAITVYPLAGAPANRLRVPSVSLTVGGRNASADLAQGRPVALLADGADTLIGFPFAVAPVAGTLSLLFQLSTPAGLAPSWSPDAVDQPTGPATLAWLYRTNDSAGSLAPLVVQDGTLGLRRSGIIRFTIFGGWTPEPTTGAYAITLRASSAAWTYPPRAIKIAPNVVTATHRRPAQFDLDAADAIAKQLQEWRLLPGNILTLPEDQRPVLLPSLEVAITERNGAKTTWLPIDDLCTAGPDDQVFVYDEATGQLRFGDGVTGRIPMPMDASSKSVSIAYDVGGGVAGNVGAALAWQFTNSRLRACNVTAAIGGRDLETVAALRDRGRELMKPKGRAITVKDFEELATQVAGTNVARARASVGRHPDFVNRVVPGAVTVYLVPDVPRQADDSPDYGSAAPFPPAPNVDTNTLDTVQAALDLARMVGSEVYARGVQYRPVTIDLTVFASPPDAQALRNTINQAIQRYLDPLVGGDDGLGWPFGGPVRPSSLLRIAQAAAGPEGTVRTAAIMLDDAADAEQSCADVRIGADELVCLTQIRIAIQRPTGGQGGLR